VKLSRVIGTPVGCRQRNSTNSVLDLGGRCPVVTLVTWPTHLLCADLPKTTTHDAIDLHHPTSSTSAKDPALSRAGECSFAPTTM
jgi:hypothetical protein